MFLILLLYETFLDVLVVLYKTNKLIDFLFKKLNYLRGTSLNAPWTKLIIRTTINKVNVILNIDVIVFQLSEI